MERRVTSSSHRSLVPSYDRYGTLFVIKVFTTTTLITMSAIAENEI
jgi:hypothetical protein